MAQYYPKCSICHKPLHIRERKLSTTITYYCPACKIESRVEQYKQPSQYPNLSCLLIEQCSVCLAEWNIWLDKKRKLFRCPECNSDKIACAGRHYVPKGNLFTYNEQQL